MNLIKIKNMNVFFFHAIILFLNFRKILMATHDCLNDHTDCFNCSTCGETEHYYLDCPCKWNSNAGTCDSDANKGQIYIFYQAFASCTDSDSASIKDKYCGSSTIW